MVVRVGAKFRLARGLRRGDSQRKFHSGQDDDIPGLHRHQWPLTHRKKSNFMTNNIWFTQATLEQLNQSSKTLIGHLGMEFTEIGDDHVTARMPVDARTHQPYGLLHGGASVALAETLGSTGASLCVDPDRFYVVGIEINANHVRGVKDGWVTGVARAIHRGRTTHIWEIKITDDAEKLVCISRITVAILEKSSAA